MGLWNGIVRPSSKPAFLLPVSFQRRACSNKVWSIYEKKYFAINSNNFAKPYLGRGEGGGLVEGEGSEKVHFEKNNLTSYLGGG